MSSIFVPFNHQPSSIAIKTSSYTIPAGSYARVTVIEYGSNFTIDGSIAAYARYYSGTGPMPISGTDIFTHSYPFTLVGSVSVTGTANFRHLDYLDQIMDIAGTSTAADITGGAAFLRMVPGDTITSNGGSGNYSYRLVAEGITEDAVFWVPTGTQLNGTRYVVELYPELS